MKTLKKRIFGLAVLLTILSCSKEKLTQPTQIGANTFSCKVNGVVHIPNDEAFSSRAISASLSLNREDSNFYNLSILTNYSRKEPSEDVYLTLYKINHVGLYKLSGTEYRYGTYILNILNKSTGFFGVTYNSRTFNKGEINITKLDLVNRIVSGTFWFEATNENYSNDKFSITDGRFDLKL